MTLTVTKEEAIRDIEQLLERVSRGDEVVITEGGREAARLRPGACHEQNGSNGLKDDPPYIVNGRRIPGRDKGLFVVPDDFNDPLPEEILRAFEGDTEQAETSPARTPRVPGRHAGEIFMSDDFNDPLTAEPSGTSSSGESADRVPGSAKGKMWVSPDFDGPALPARRMIGSAKGEFVVPDDFNDPLPDDVIDLFYK